jgi:hypothetical protein
MHFFINELSFLGQAKNIYEADQLIKELYSIIENIQPIQRSNPIQTHSEIANKIICPELTLHQWFQKKIKSKDITNQTIAKFLVKIITKGPFIDQTGIIDSCQCYFNNQEVHQSSLSGAAYHNGILISLQGSSDFSQGKILVKFSRDAINHEDIEVNNLITVDQVLKIRCYKASPKHSKTGQRGVKGTLMDLSDEDAQKALYQGIVHGRQIYSYYNERFYEFQSDNADTFHGYPVLEKDVPHKAFKQLKNMSM